MRDGGDGGGGREREGSEKEDPVIYKEGNAWEENSVNNATNINECRIRSIIDSLRHEGRRGEVGGAREINADLPAKMLVVDGATEGAGVRNAPDSEFGGEEDRVTGIKDVGDGGGGIARSIGKHQGLRHQTSRRHSLPNDIRSIHMINNLYTGNSLLGTMNTNHQFKRLNGINGPSTQTLSHLNVGRFNGIHKHNSSGSHTGDVSGLGLDMSTQGVNNSLHALSTSIHSLQTNEPDRANVKSHDGGMCGEEDTGGVGGEGGGQGGEQGGGTQEAIDTNTPSPPLSSSTWTPTYSLSPTTIVETRPVWHTATTAAPITPIPTFLAPAPRTSLYASNTNVYCAVDGNGKGRHGSGDGGRDGEARGEGQGEHERKRRGEAEGEGQEAIFLFRGRRAATLSVVPVGVDGNEEGRRGSGKRGWREGGGGHLSDSEEGHDEGAYESVSDGQTDACLFAQVCGVLYVGTRESGRKGVCMWACTHVSQCVLVSLT